MKITLPENVKSIIETLTTHGFEAYAVGGCVRDTLLQRTPGDWDITTSALPEEVKKLFRHTIDTGIEHGTVTVMMNHVGYEVTTYRIDGDYKDSRHPESVLFTRSLMEDLKRRDFTINAMAYNDQDGLVDLFHGQEDLEAGLLRAVGEPRERFKEDALRILRCIRFSAQLGFSIEAETYKACKELSDTLRNISIERIRDEFLKTLMSDHPDHIRLLLDIGALSLWFPEFEEMMRCEQNTPYHNKNVGEHTIGVLLGVRKDKLLRLSALFHDTGKLQMKTTDQNGVDHFKKHALKSAEITDERMKDLRFDNDTRKRVVALVRKHDLGIDTEKKEVRRTMGQMLPEDFERLLELIHADMMAKSDYAIECSKTEFAKIRGFYEDIKRDHDCTSLKELKVSGKDLASLGMKPGKWMGECLDFLLEAVLEDPALNEKDRLLELAVHEFSVKEA